MRLPLQLALLAAALAHPLAPAGAAPLPLGNPGFEDSLSGWNVQEANVPMSLADPAAARSGGLGLRIHDSDTALGSAAESTPFPAVPGHVYRLSFHARAVDRVPGCGVYLRFRDLDNKLLPNPPARAIPGETAGWTPLDLQVVAPADVASVSVWVHSFSTSTGTWDIDDIVVEEFDSLAAATAANAVPYSPPPVASSLPEPRVPVVLKLDDLVSTREGAVPERWRRVTDFARERNLKISAGIICDSLEGEKPAYFSYIKELHSSGSCEFWFHGYDHKQWDEGGRKLQEFNGTSYEHQKDHFVKSQALAKEKLGFAFAAFGSPFNATDATTSRVLAEDPDIKVLLFGNAGDRASGKVVLDRVGPVNIEIPLFVPNPEKFAEAYGANAKGRKYYVLQGHPNQWDDARWAAFVRLVDFLQQNRIPVVTPSELAASL